MLPYLWFAFHWLAMSHSCYNPVIYCYMNARFRGGFRHIWQRLVYGRWWCACLRRRGGGGGLARPDGAMRARRSTQIGLAGKCDGGKGKNRRGGGVDVVFRVSMSVIAGFENSSHCQLQRANTTTTFIGNNTTTTSNATNKNHNRSTVVRPQIRAAVAEQKSTASSATVIR